MLNLCPICDAELICNHEDFIANHLCESYEACSVCGYWTEFAYGATRTGIGGREWISSYSDNDEDAVNKQQELKTIIQLIHDALQRIQKAR